VSNHINNAKKSARAYQTKVYREKNQTKSLQNPKKRESPASYKTEQISLISALSVTIEEGHDRFHQKGIWLQTI
jgi:hypothetical protein